MRRPLFGLAAALGAIALSLAGAHAALAADATVAMRGFQFVPASVTLNVGDSVTWRNDDGVPHSASADDGAFDTGVFDGGSRSVTLTQPGTFGYFCAVHPSTMRGTVNVLAAATAPPQTARPATPRPTAAPPTVAPATPTPVPTPAATPTVSPTEAPTATAAATPSSVAVQASPTPTGSSQPGDGDAIPLVAAAIAAGIALTGVAFWLIRRR